MDTSTLPNPAMDEPTADLGPGPADVPPTPPGLRRSRSGRMLAGVARGLARRFDVDVSLVRVAFVVLAVAWGLGIVIYAAMWALVPREVVGTEESVPEDGEPTAPWLAYLLLAAVLVFGLLVVSSWWGGPRWGGSVGLLWLVLLFGLLAVAMNSSSGRFRIRRLLAALALVVLSFVILAAATTLAIVAWTDVPIAGGIGERVYVPASFNQVLPSYHLAVGDLDVNLSKVTFPPGRATHVTATVAIGLVRVDVPPDVVVDVNAHSGVGAVTSSTGSVEQFGQPTGAGATATHPRLVLTVQAGIGEVRLVREPSGSPS